MVFANIFTDRNSNKNEPRSDAEMTVFQYFPVLMGACRTNLSQAQIDAIIAKVLKIWTDNPVAAPNDYVNGWQKSLSRQEQLLFSDLLWLVDSKVKLYLKRLKYKDAVYMSNVYLTIGGKNSYIKKHVHSAINFLSGCLYLQTPGGDFGFNNPVEFQQFPILENNQSMPEWATFIRSFKPEPGLLLLFPPYLPHWTEINTTDTIRVSLVFNYRLLAE